VVEFKPVDGVIYKNPYQEIFKNLYGKSEDEKLETYRYLCCTDLFFLVYFGLQKHWLNDSFRVARWVTDRCKDIEEGPRTNTIDLWQRGGFKSTLLTIGESLQDVLRDPTERICIFAFNRALAKDFLGEIKQICEGGGDNMLPIWFPDIFWENPKRDAHKWSLDDGLFLKRPNIAKEGTFEAWGLVDSQPTGMHFTKRVYDDMVDKRSVFTIGMIEKTLDAFRLSQNLGDLTRNRQRIVGTRYDYSDTYGTLEEMAKKGELELTIRERPGIVQTRYGPEYHLFTEQEFAEKRAIMGEYVFSCQVQLNPVSSENQKFKREHLTFWTSIKDLMAQGLESWPKYMLGDMAGWGNMKKGGKTLDRSAFGIVAAPPDGRWILLDLLVGRYEPSNIMEWLFKSHNNWRWIKGGMEEEKLANTLMYFLKPMMQDSGHHLNIIGLPHKNRQKHDRIQFLQPLWEQGKIVLHPEEHVEAIQAFLRYPADEHNMDILDMLAYGQDLILAPTVRKYKSGKKRRPTALNSRGSW